MEQVNRAAWARVIGLAIQRNSAMTRISRPVLLRCTYPLVLALAMLGVSAASFAGTFVSVTIAPPVLPVYAQPIAPGPGYIWTPGYWAYGPDGYYWVPGTWVTAPFVGALWTPGYWGWGNGLYVWHTGYWGPRVGFYGGVNYGFGYLGVGYQGGYWTNGAFYYNRAVNNVNVTNIQTTYNTTVVNNKNVMTRVSYNGGAGGINARPSAAELAAASEPHTQPTAMQQQHQQAASTNRALLASVNHGRPSIAATPQPGAFDHPRVVAAKGASAVSMPANGAMRSQNAPHVGPGQRDATGQSSAGHPQVSAVAPHAQGSPHAARGNAESQAEAQHLH